MERILRGIMRYRNTTREQMVREFQKVRDHPEVCSSLYVVIILYNECIIRHPSSVKRCTIEYIFAIKGGTLVNCVCVFCKHGETG